VVVAAAVGGAMAQLFARTRAAVLAACIPWAAAA
jgi:hypothetical protein